MKLTNKILEVINQGIKFALDDFDDNEEIHGQVNNKVKYQGGTKEWLDLMEEVVDLGLPSGTLWCKYNLGAKHKYDYGDYYAWGELTTKDNYDSVNYIYKDGFKQLPPEFDVATQTLGNYYSIPTKEQCEELIKYTKAEYKQVIYNESRIYGCLFIGKNGNQLFIPAAGEYTFDVNDNINSIGTIWTSTNNGIGYSWCLTFNDNDKCPYMCIKVSCFGRSIRPVINL